MSAAFSISAKPKGMVKIGALILMVFWMLAHMVIYVGQTGSKATTFPATPAVRARKRAIQPTLAPTSKQTSPSRTTSAKTCSSREDGRGRRRRFRRTLAACLSRCSNPMVSPQSSRDPRIKLDLRSGRAGRGDRGPAGGGADPGPPRPPFDDPARVSGACIELWLDVRVQGIGRRGEAGLGSPRAQAHP